MYDTILLPTDGRNTSNPAIEHGIELARKFGATIHVLYTIEMPYLEYVDDDEWNRSIKKSLRKDGIKATEDIANRAREYSLEVVTAIETGLPFQVISEYTTTHGIDLITLGTAGTSAKSRVIGSTAKKVVRLAEEPVLTVRTAETVPSTDYEKIILATDGSPGSQRAIGECAILAEKYDASVQIVSVIDIDKIQSESFIDSLEETGRRICEDAMEQLSAAGIHATSHILWGNPADRILTYADEQDADLIVLGTHGRSGWELFVLGSVAEAVLSRTAIPVLTARNMG